jgi:uncharacterized protein (DUF433 family)
VTNEELLERITIDPNVAHGQPCVRGTRVLVTTILDALAAGLTPGQVIEHYPSIDEGDVRAALAFASWLTKQEIHTLPRRR